MADNMTIALAIAGTFVVIYLLYKLLENESIDDVHERTQIKFYYDDDTGNNNLDHQTPISNLNNNHDQDKRPYRSKEDAEVVIQKMKRQGHDPNDTLVSYFNTELGAWFIGNNKKYY